MPMVKAKHHTMFYNPALYMRKPENNMALSTKKPNSMAKRRTYKRHSSSSQMPCLEQTSAIMILHLSLSSVIRSKAMLSLLFPVTKELKLSRNVILCLPLLLVPSILPVRDKNSSPLWRHMWPKNFSCLY